MSSMNFGGEGRLIFTHDAEFRSEFARLPFILVLKLLTESEARQLNHDWD